MLKVAGGGGGGVAGAVAYQGTWNASTNTPTLTSSSGTQGHYYVVSVAGTTTLDGISSWAVGDWAIFNGSYWEKVDNTDAVSSVNGQVGTVVLTAASVSAIPDVAIITAGTGMSGGGTLISNVTISLANTTVVAGTYGNASGVAVVVVDAQGRLTSASTVAIDIDYTAVSGLGTIATQDASAVSILGGSIAASAIDFLGITSVSATFASPALPLVPEGYIQVSIGGASKKIPYYGV